MPKQIAWRSVDNVMYVPGEVEGLVCGVEIVGAINTGRVSRG
jgi:hypothetical protein